MWLNCASVTVVDSLTGVDSARACLHAKQPFKTLFKMISFGSTLRKSDLTFKTILQFRVGFHFDRRSTFECFLTKVRHLVTVKYEEEKLIHKYFNSPEVFMSSWIHRLSRNFLLHNLYNSVLHFSLA